MILEHPFNITFSVIYLVSLLLFLRILGWMAYARRRYWRPKAVLTLDTVLGLAEAEGRELPFISLLVPARGEAAVVGSTICHLAALVYPTDRFEIIVATDQKELLERAVRGLTTQEVVERVLGELGGAPVRPPTRHVVVPADYDGYPGGRLTGAPVPSTKGRALNYAAAFVDSRCELLGYYDADSRPDCRVLLYAAARWLAPRPPDLMQGPVFQVRNFFRLGPLSKIAALFQAASHEWYLPVVMRKLPFVGGTNLYISRGLLDRIGGFDPTCLTEDLELGVRSCLTAGAWPEYLPVVSTEQTPATLQAFLRQRLRWASGYVQVYRRLCRPGTGPEQARQRLRRTLWLQGPLVWGLYQALSLLAPLGWLAAETGWLDPTALSPRRFLSVLSPIYLAFTFCLFHHYRRFMAPEPRPFSRLLGLAQLLMLPVAAFFLPLPYSGALLFRALGMAPHQWVKTPRTPEAPGSGTRVPALCRNTCFLTQPTTAIPLPVGCRERPGP